MKWVIRAYSFVLLGYTAWRTVDFLLSQLPKNDISLWLSLAFLFAAEVGLILWHEISIRHTSTLEQHYISVTLTWVDFVASLAAGIADMILRQNMIEGYTIPPILAQALIFGLPLVMAANVGGVLLYLSNDAETRLETAKKQLRFEVHKQAIKELTDQKSAVAASMKGDIARQLKADVTGRLVREFMRAPVEQPSQAQPVIHPSGNGKAAVKSYNLESEAVPDFLPQEGKK